jgi:hypothetical protein
VSCLDVRGLLGELAVDALPAGDRAEVERHLRWCAGCRKEASELRQAAATVGFSLAPAPLPPGLDERVVERVRRATGRRETPRRARTAAAAILAAMVAIGSLGWGAVMAGRADRFAARAERAERSRAEAIERFQQVLAGVGILPVGIDELPDDQTYLGRLVPTAEGQGAGQVLQLVSPTIIDFTIVVVNGLDPQGTERLPYRIELLDETGQILKAGRIDEIDADGGGEEFHEFPNGDLTGFDTVRVVDATGRVVLVGEVDQTP